MSEVETDEINNHSQNSLLKTKSKESVNDELSSKSKRVVFQEKPIILNKVSQKVSDSTIKSEPAENEKKDKKERNRPPTKVVVRRLPPTMILETFVDNVSPLPEHDYIYFVRADMSLGPNAFSRAYINFLNMDDLLTFYEQFDNYVFMDSKGNEYPAVVEFAPFQRVPKKRPGRKKDPKVGTLNDDPAFISFIASLKEKKDTSSVKQASAEHLLALTSESSSKRDVSTPLLEFIKQRRAERQRVRDEKREERKRKELERKRIKEEERKRRKDHDSVLKVLRNPEHDDKEDFIKNGKERDRSQQMIKRREEERKHREKDRKEKRELKGRDGPPKAFRDERQKPIDVRVSRKVIDDQRRKLGVDGNQIQNKSDFRHNLEFEKGLHTKEGDKEPRKPPGFSREQNLKKGPNDKYQMHSKDDRYSKDVEYRKSYKENDMKKIDKSQSFMKENEYKKGTFESKKGSFNDNDTRKKTNDTQNLKNSEILEVKCESSKSQTSEESDIKKWELLGAKPKQIISEDNVTDTTRENKDDIKKDSTHAELKGKFPESSHIMLCGIRKPVRIPIEAVKCDAVPGVLLKRRSSLETDSLHTRTFDHLCSKPRRQASLDSEIFLKNVSCDNYSKNISESRSQEFDRKINSIHITRRNSLDSGDVRKASTTYGFGSLSECGSDYFAHEPDKKLVIISKLSTDVQMNATGDCGYEENEDSKEVGNQNLSEEQKVEKNKGNAPKTNENKMLENSSGEGNKRDPRAERRIRNKDRPSIEIYRPGMGRFSMQRKEREKNAGISSSTEQESPSNSPSPTPSTRPSNNSKSVKTNSELRSMTFKRSVSREK